MHPKIIVASLTALFLAASVSAFGAKGSKVNGIITSRTGETLIVSSPEGKTTVVLTDDTTTKDDKGLLGLDKQKLSSVVLIPGLKVKVDGTPDDQGRIIAKTITTDGDDLETAEMIQAGLHPTAEQVSANVQHISANKQNISTNQQNISDNQQNIAANKQNVAANKQQIDANIKDITANTQRFTALSEYDVKGEATAKFDAGSYKLSAQDQQELKQLAQTAKGLTGYIIEVTGYTDSSGSPAVNTKLSEQRARAVVTCLLQQGGVPVRHIIAPGAMGEYGPAASNETKAGRADNRRVEVKILVNKGISGS
jgi:outer membrane protein OmpA-like peptidoglycan-associated protein